MFNESVIKALPFIAFAFQCMGFLVRDELWLRLLILSGTCFYQLYYFFGSSSPQTSMIITSGMLGLINFVMIIVLVFERTTFAMSEETARIYRSFPTLNPGQFRRVLKAGVTKTAPVGEVLVTDGAPLKRLFLVTKGQVMISKSDVEYEAKASVFIGEVSFLRQGSASATVKVSEEATYVEWKHADLRQMMKKSAAMNNALIALFGAELAGKVEQAMPVDLVHKTA
jgi:Cyclic nucleotide-binding domain